MEKGESESLSKLTSEQETNRLAAVEWEKRIQIVRQHYEDKGYRVHSGFQFGCELVLYADDPAKVHSDFCVHVIPERKLFTPHFGEFCRPPFEPPHNLLQLYCCYN